MGLLPNRLRGTSGITDMPLQDAHDDHRRPAASWFVFAASVKRKDITQGAELLGMEVNEHITQVITAMQGAAAELGLAD